MKSSYELAMERLAKTSPTVKLTAGQKAELVELESRYSARIAEREIGLKDQITKSTEAGNYEEVRELEQQLAREKKKLQAECEEKKELVRQSKRS